MPADLSAFSGQFPPAVLQAAQSILESKPDQLASFQNEYGGDLERWLQAFEGFWSNPANTGSVDLNQFGPESALMGALGYAVNPAAPGPQASLNTTGGGTPLEQALLQGALPGLLNDVNGDAERRKIADTLAQQTLAGAGAASTQIGRTQGGRFDGNTYLSQNPDVAADFANKGGEAGTGMTIDQFAEKHYLEFGQREGRQPIYIQSAQLAQDFNNADTTQAANIAAANQALQTQLGALSTATTALQGNLQGELAAKAAALQQQLATLNQNLDTLDATQRKALVDAIAAQQANLEQSIATQRQALQDQVAALGTAADAQAQAKRTALQEEIAGLTAAQAPLNAAREQAAQMQATAINVGLEHTKDQLTADNARAGFVGGSTVQDAALARATIGARGDAARAMGDARVLNATDDRQIGFRGATGQRTIADALADAQNAIAGTGATGNAALTGSLATGRRTLGDAAATGGQALTNQTALTRAAIGAQGANTTYGDAVGGAAGNRSLLDALAQGTYGLTSTNANQTLAAQQQGNAARATYQDQDYNRTLAGALALPGIAGQTATTLTGLDNYAQSGLGRTQNLLSWWNTNPAAAPTPGAIATTAPTTGNDWANLGAGITKLGASGIDWTKIWGTKKPAVPAPSVPA